MGNTKKFEDRKVMISITISHKALDKVDKLCREHQMRRSALITRVFESDIELLRSESWGEVKADNIFAVSHACFDDC